MRIRSFLIIGAVLVGSGCADIAGVGSGSPDAQSRLGVLDDAVGTATRAATMITDAAAQWLPYRSRLALETYDTTFVVVQGAASRHAIRFADDSEYGAGVVFLELDIPATAQFLTEHGDSARAGDAVPLTVTVDSLQLKFTFGPHGSTFAHGRAARLRILYECTEYNLAEDPSLRLWYQPDLGGPWSLQDNVVEIVDGYAVTSLYHFSNYAMAF